MKDILKSRKAGMNVTITSLFAVFLVIFVVFVAITSLRGRTSILEQREHFDYYTLTDSFLLSFLGNPTCLTVGDYYNENKQAPIQGLIDSHKINRSKNTNSDPGCIENFYFLYSVGINDSKTGEAWLIGIDKKEYPWVEREITTSLPVAIMYDESTINMGEAVLNVYIGQIPLLYGALKRVCNTEQSDSFSIDTNYVISYDYAKNQFCVAKDCFYAYFTCKIGSFKIPKGEHMVYLSYKNDSIKVIV